MWNEDQIKTTQEKPELVSAIIQLKLTAADGKKITDTLDAMIDAT